MNRKPFKFSVLALGLCSLLTLFLTGCSDPGKKPANEEKITTDILENGGNCFWLNGQIEDLEIKSLELTRHKTDEDAGTDEAYVSASLENEYYTVDVEYLLYYSFYDVGGWVLDTYSVEDYQAIPTQPYIDEDSFIDYCSNYFNNIEIIDHTYGLEEDIYQDSISFSGTVDSNYLTETFIGNVNFAFYDDCWNESCIIEPYSTDWSRLLGTWQFTHHDEYIEIDITDINQIDSENISISYNYKTSPWYDDGPWNGYFWGYSTTGTSRDELAQTATLELSRTEAFFDGTPYSYVNDVYTRLRIVPGGYEDYSASFFVNIGINDGLYMDDFLMGYKNEGSAGAWDLASGETVYFEKNSTSLQKCPKAYLEHTKAPAFSMLH